MLDPKKYKELDEALAAFQPDILIVDVFNNTHNADENSEAGMTEVMDRYEALRRKHGCTILLVHHYRKGGAFQRRDGAQMLRGSTVLAGWAENSLYLTKNAQGIRVEPESKDTMVEPFVYRMQGDDDAMSLTYVGDAKSAKVHENLDRVREAAEALFLEEGRHGTTRAKIAKRLDMSANTVRKHLDALVADGVLAPAKVVVRGQSASCYLPIQDGKEINTTGEA